MKEMKEEAQQQRLNNVNTVVMSEEEKNKWEEERSKLFEQLDEKVSSKDLCIL